MVACVALVLGFRESSDLAAAYGIAVTGTMAITSILFYFVARDRWGWSRAHAGVLLALFLAFDLSFFVACSAKIAHGGWFPLLVAVGIFTVMMTWKRGRALLGERIAAESLPLETFLDDIEVDNPHRVAGTAVFLTSTRRGTPAVLLHHFKHNKVLHQQVVILSIVTDAVPEVAARRLRPPQVLRPRLLGRDGALRLHADARRAGGPARLRDAGPRLNEADTSFYLGRETLLHRQGQRAWRLAQAPLPLPLAQRALGDRLLRDPAEPRRRDRDADRAVRCRRAGDGGAGGPGDNRALPRANCRAECARRSGM